MSGRRILVTGAAGFIGAAVCRRLLDGGDSVVGIDNLNEYYDVSLKNDRLAALEGPGFRFHQVDIADASGLRATTTDGPFDHVIHLAAQAGVRYSLSNPGAYVSSNLAGFVNLLETCRATPPRHLVFASSSSVYGANDKLPYSETDRVERPVSLYAATKRSNELIAYTYSHLFGIATTGLRFFTVYGPWGRPDMAYYSFTRRMLAGEPITVFNRGEMKRDFTYIDDIVSGVVGVLEKAPTGDEDAAATRGAPYRILNIGNNKPTGLMRFIEILEEATGVKAQVEFAPMQEGDVFATFADISAINELTGFSPTTDLATGLDRFVTWYRKYHQANQ